MNFFLYNAEIEEQLKQIRQALHVRMNGEVSENLTLKGFEYKLNYGTLLPEIKELSKRYTPNKLLAERLWSLKIRETMILSTYLYPIDEFLPDTAEDWVDSISTTEIAEIACMNLFSKLPYAETKILKWINSERKITQISGWILLARLCKNIQEKDLFVYIEKAADLILSENSDVKNSIILAVKNIAKTNKTNADKVLSILSERHFSDSMKKYYDEIQQDLNFYYNL